MKVARPRSLATSSWDFSLWHVKTHLKHIHTPSTYTPQARAHTHKAHTHTPSTLSTHSHTSAYTHTHQAQREAEGELAEHLPGQVCDICTHLSTSANLPRQGLTSPPPKYLHESIETAGLPAHGPVAAQAQLHVRRAAPTFWLPPPPHSQPAHCQSARAAALRCASRSPAAPAPAAQTARTGSAWGRQEGQCAWAYVCLTLCAQVGQPCGRLRHMNLQLENSETGRQKPVRVCLCACCVCVFECVYEHVCVKKKA